MRDLDWLSRHGDVDGGDVTDAFAVLGVMGPASRDLLGRVSADDWSEDGFPFATSRTATVAGVPLRATRMTYVGELGWELTVPVARAGAVHDVLFGEGADLGIRNAGYYAIDSLRLEKGFRAFPRELSPDYTPVEAGLVFATALKADKPFLGREALERFRDRWPRAARAAGWSPSSSTRPTRCSGAASSCCGTADPPARSRVQPGARPSARRSAWPTCARRGRCHGLTGDRPLRGGRRGGAVRRTTVLKAPLG